MDLTDKISLFYKEKYSLEDIDSGRISHAINKFDYNPFLDKLRKYFNLCRLMKYKGEFNEELGILFLRYDDFPSDLDLIYFGKEIDEEKSIQIFFKRHALKEETIFKQIRKVNSNASKIFLEKALEHILICENPNLWKEPDISINHLKALSSVATRLAYLEENIDDRISLFELNYKTLIKKGDNSKGDYDRGFHYLRRLFECCTNLTLSYFKKRDVEKSKEYFNLALSYLNRLETVEIKSDNLTPQMLDSLANNIEKLNRLTDNPRFNKTLKEHNRL